MNKYSWQYKGKTAEGNTATFSGSITAPDDSTAFKSVEDMMRLKHPNIKWMHGKNIETETLKYGPTIRKLKTL